MADALQDSSQEARTWVEANAELAEEAYQHFLRDGEWPDIPTLQRRFDRSGHDVEVQDAVDSMPHVAFEGRLLHADRLALHLRHLMWIDPARPLVTICVRAVQRAVDSYLSDDSSPQVTSDDNLTQFPSDLHGGLRMRAYTVLTTENPSPFGGSNRREDWWSIQVDPRFARRFRDVESASDFVARQDLVRADVQRETQAFYGATVLTPDVAEVGDEDEFASGEDLPPLLFLSWAGPTSRSVAAALKPALDERLPGVEVFFSPQSIEPGEDPNRRMFDEGLLRASALVAVLTEEGSGRPYVVWETATAWARDKLVIPIFVDIEPAAVPGPLASKVQGVRLADHGDVDRAIARLATRFGLPQPDELSNEEYFAVREAARSM